MTYLASLLRKLMLRLEKAGAWQTAQEVRGFMRVAAARDDPRTQQWMQRKYDRLNALYERRQAGSKSDEKAYAAAAKESLDDMLRRREAGPPDERLYVWFCLRSADSCGPCRARHGRMRTLRQWRAEGMPGPQVCAKPECGCALFPLRPGGTMPAGVQHLNDGDAAAGMIGLRQDNSAENMQQGFALMPFWSNSGGMF